MGRAPADSAPPGRRGVGQIHRVGPGIEALADRADRVGRHEHDPVDDRVADQGVPGKKPGLVVPEVVECVAAITIALGGAASPCRRPSRKPVPEPRAAARVPGRDTGRSDGGHHRWLDNSVRIGYARVSTRTQDYQAKPDALAAAHCRDVVVETAAGRPGATPPPTLTPRTPPHPTLELRKRHRWRLVVGPLPTGPVIEAALRVRPLSAAKGNHSRELSARDLDKLLAEVLTGEEAPQGIRCVLEALHDIHLGLDLLLACPGCERRDRL